MLHPLRAALGASLTAVVAAASLVLSTPSGALLAPEISFAPVGAPLQVGSMSVLATLSTACDAVPEASAITFAYDGSPTTMVSASVVSASQFTFVIPSGLRTVTGALDRLEVSITCPVATAPVQYSGIVEWAQIDITKVVVGEGPIDGRFTINGACGFDGTDSGPTPTVSTMTSPAQSTPIEFTVRLTAGEKTSLFLSEGAICEFAESDGLGATSTSISPTELVVDEPTLYAVTVTNTFPTATPRFTG